MPLPVEFVVPGIPVPGQGATFNRGTWQAVVAAAAVAAWGADPPITDDDLELLVIHLHEQHGGNIDNDNMVKPIQDALKNVVYVDDRQITDLLAFRRPIESVQLVSPTAEAAAAVAQGVDLVIIRVRKRTEGVDFG